MTSFFRGSRNSSAKPRRSNKPEEVPEIKPSRSGFELARSLFRKARKENASMYEARDSRDKPSGVGSTQDHKRRQDHGSRAHSMESQSKNGDCNPTLLTSIKNGGIAISSMSHNFKYYPALPVKGVTLTKAEKDGLNLEDDSHHPEQHQLGYMPFGNAPEKIQRDVKEALKTMKKKLCPGGDELCEPVGLVMTHSTFFDTALGERRGRWEQAVKDWAALGAKTRSWDWTNANSHAEFSRLWGCGEDQSFHNSRQRDAVVARDQEERSYSQYLESKKCAPNSFEDAITNLILKRAMFYCGDQKTQAAREASKEAEDRFEKEREEKMIAAQVDSVLRVARESKLRRNDRDRAQQQELLAQEIANQVNEKAEQLGRKQRIKKREKEREIEVKEEKTRSVEGKGHAALFLGGLVLL